MNWLLLLVVSTLLGCQPRRELVKPQVEKVYVGHHLDYQLQPGFSIGELKDGTTAVYHPSNHDFGFTIYKPGHPKNKAITLSQIREKLLSDLKGDLKREGKKDVHMRQMRFGGNEFKGFSYQDSFKRVNLEGYIVVGTTLAEALIYLPEPTSTGKDLLIREAMIKMLTEIKEDTTH